MAQFLMEKFITNGSAVIDATAGNGYDTLFLAKSVGPSGQVYAFDIQETAIRKTTELLKQNNCLDRVKLINDGHENINKYVNVPVQAVVYNLGYLPGGLKDIVTRSDTTMLSLQQSVELLSPGGVISILVYTGHSGGLEEAGLIEEYLEKLPPRNWSVMKWNRKNGSEAMPPYLLFVNKHM